ncbi:sulfur carrier protein [Aquimarina sp. EL_43]|uniref:sulfur carrier protein ThiS n=1 Tax=Aquimarina TaxID=290174 RepID=UPI00046F3A88|nr:MULTISPECIES: sulfur carrier protein ThiS [Aquimarina]MBG6131954.1 sulfur carrier protein [Aquimarina sp. EL_35]MBG6149518.1 sulfur carrier protein [Aquimarina sp. EL_32]MBG6170219.1 sulfur carrier protein [Aquimarina sp. EL_43]
MTINVNNQSQSISENSSIKKLLEQLDILPNGIAIAINNKVISKEEWEQTMIENDDDIVIIKATQGG